jgi:hypothetical protein
MERKGVEINWFEGLMKWSQMLKKKKKMISWKNIENFFCIIVKLKETEKHKGTEQKRKKTKEEMQMEKDRKGEREKGRKGER